MNRQKVSARDIFEMLLDENVLSVSLDESGRISKNELLSGIRTVQRYLRRREYHQGKGKRV